ncbi:DNA polymerase/3'-5' exonuclease PolX [Desulfolucanica intricata]|uniref:DNA polymerase/3'-5' exonuclease PolX n=1 Tax=Desulfolucanica intricata TaxID=1285191 RepID=UPI000833B4D9|nr:DNA polymerase/3'-5' exonuclease PolX [Desulfolucanica intricata]
MHNIEIAWIFDELADLLEFLGESFFKVRAYRRAAHNISGLDTSLRQMHERGQLDRIPGVGKNIAGKIAEILDTGKLRQHQELLQKVPPGLLEVMRLPGIGPKKGSIICEHLGVTSLDELEEAARARKLRKLPGMGVKTEQDILRHIRMHRHHLERVLLSTARDLAREIIEYLSVLPEVERLEVAGSTRRWQETVGDLDLVCASTTPDLVINALIDYPRVTDTLILEENRVRVMTWWGIPVDLEIVTPDKFELALHRATGSKEHYRRLKELALKKNWKLGVNGFTGPGAPFPLTEEHIYSSLGLSYIPPELREDRGEIEKALNNELPQLIELSDIKGDLHVHTNWSDGTNSLEQIIERAKEKGYSYLAITDHSQSLKIAKGLSLERLQEQHRVIRKLDQELADFHLFTGIEVDILSKGLDYPDEILQDIDVVVASVHTGFRQDSNTLTNRIIAAVENEHVDIIGHLTGRLICQREPYDIDIEKILEAAAKYNTALEINASPDRLDLNDEHARLAAQYGVKLTINTDAHDLRRMDEMVYGVSVARRAGLKAEDVINTWKPKQLIHFLRKH